MTIEIELRVLFLDDDFIRHEVFSDIHADERVREHHVWSSPQAIKSIEECPKFDIIFLDHDLSDQHYTGRGYEHPGTGMDVVDFMCKGMNKDKIPGSIVIHSWNIDRAQEMERRLKEAGFANVVRSEFGKKRFFKLP